MKTNYKITIGADPEFFVVSKETGKVVPSCDRFGGSKKSPIFLCPDGGYLEDGATVEFNVTPSATLAEARAKIQNLIIIFLSQNPGYTISPDSSAKFEKNVIQSNPKMSVIGCDADLWAWGLRDLPNIKSFRGWRFAGGHIHVGIDPWPQGLERKSVIQMLDAFVGIRCLRWTDKKRYSFYGYPGLYRHTDYGVEWRSPDNMWCNPVGSMSRAMHFAAEFSRAINLLKRGLQNVEPNLLNTEIKLYLEEEPHLGPFLMGKGIVKKSPQWGSNFSQGDTGHLLMDWLSSYKDVA